MLVGYAGRVLVMAESLLQLKLKMAYDALASGSCSVKFHRRFGCAIFALAYRSMQTGLNAMSKDKESFTPPAAFICCADPLENRLFTPNANSSPGRVIRL
jgi:hypothetical protein